MASTILSAEAAAQLNSAKSPYDSTSSTGMPAPYSTTPTATEPSRHARPTLEEVLERAKEDMDYWEPRNARFQRHQNLYDLREKDPQEGQILAYLNDPRVYIDKISGLIARRSHRIEVPAKPSIGADVAQRIENALRWWGWHVARRWAEGLHNPLAYDEAQSILLRGWVCERLMLNTKDPGFVDISLFDPYSVYPRMHGKTISRVTHVYYATPEEIKSDFPKWGGDTVGGDLGAAGKQPVQCIAYYENKPPYWHAVATKEGWIKEPVSLDYFPWVMAVARGAMTHGSIGMDYDHQHTANIGCGFLDSIESMYALLNKFITILANTASKQENPPLAIATIDGKPKEISIEAGGRTPLLLSENFKEIEVGPKMGQFIPLLTTLQDRINKATLPSAMFGEGTALESGFMSALMMGAAQDVLWTFITALGTFHAMKYERFLHLFEEHSDHDMEYVSKARRQSMQSNVGAVTTQPGAVTARAVTSRPGARVWGEKLSVEDIQRNGIYVEVYYEDISPQDRVALGQLAAVLVKTKLISLSTARDKYLGLDDPGIENEKVLADLIYLDEEAVKSLAMEALSSLGLNRELNAMKAAQQAQMQQQSGPPQQVGGPPQQVGGPPQGPPPGGPPPPGSPPPELANIPPEVLMALLSALGGQGGLPPGVGGPPPPANILGPRGQIISQVPQPMPAGPGVGLPTSTIPSEMSAIPQVTMRNNQMPTDEQLLAMLMAGIPM